MNSKVLQYFRDHGVACATVSGDSMNPVLKNGDRVIALPVSPGVGDIVVFKREDILFIHRVIIKFGDTFYTMGDNSSFPDHPVRREDILGVVSGNTHLGRITFLTQLKALYCLFKNRIKRIRTG